MKRTPLKRKTPMKRTGWRRGPKPERINDREEKVSGKSGTRRRARRKNSYARRPRFTDHMVWVKTLPCAAQGLDGHVCSGPVEADHAAPRAMGRKCHDFQTIPLCKAAHDARPGRRYPFDRFTRESFREWLDIQLNRTMDLGLVESPQRADLVAWMRSKMPDVTDGGIRLAFRNWP